ncbi:TonB-dependent siderophore receptor [Phenylobacterium sp.]|uniref:TonB-dependent receptor plug domain-containing protein n=1 Tax=Phenylobacterium sp. TaxID=1871053 RepID=UPI0025F68026|nr:TonB-dependent receptor [Phenylobacterium sp.]MBX3485510.1 TonB-dependent receptor [Phenylobacterium sp.]MCW5760647.1 TonB-dependent receptor [Phenylobacterium sp.]
MGPWLLIAAAAPPAAEIVVANTPPPAAPAERGITAYPPGFFAEAQPTSAYDMVIRLPGFTFDKGAAVRGLAGAAGNVIIDGQPPVSKNDALDEILKRIPAGSVERIELIRGGAPGIDMDGRSVLANVVRRQAAGFKAAVSPIANFIYDGRVLNSLRAEAQWRWPGGRSAELSQVYGKGPNEELGDGVRTRVGANGAVRLRSNVDVDSGGQRIYTIGAFETPALGGRVRLNGAYQLNPSFVELYDRYVGGGKEYEYDRIDRRQIETGLRFSRALGATTGLEVIAFRQMNDSDTTVHFEAPALVRDFALDRESTETVGRVTLKRRQSPRLSFEGSLEGALNRLDSETSLTVNGRAVVVPAANVQFEEKRAELAGRVNWRATETLALEAAVRQEQSTVTSRGDVALEKTLRFTKPRVAATWSPSPVNQVRLRLEREVGQLNFDDFVATSNVASTGTLSAGNPDLTPQQAWVFEAAAERRFWGGGALVLTVRHFELSDVVDRVPIFGPTGAILADSPGNIGNGTKDEYALNLTLPLDRLGVPGAQFRGYVIRRRTRVTDPLTGIKREISVLRPADVREGSQNGPVSWEAHFTQDLPAIHTVWGADVVGGFRETTYRLSEIETRKVTATVLLFAEYKAAPDLTLRVEAQAMNQRNARRIREVYVGPRSRGVLDYTDVRDLEWGGSLYFRARKTFG